MPPICIGCELASGSSSLATILSILGAATGVTGTIVGVLGYLKSERNRQDALFREEFERYRVPLETAIQSMKRSAVAFRSSAHALTPIQTLVANFKSERLSADQAVEALLSEADEIDLRELMRSQWVPKLRPGQLAIETAWDIIYDPAQSEPAMRQAAATIIASLDVLISATRSEISSCVKRASRHHRR